jgi:ribonuclease HI
MIKSVLQAIPSYVMSIYLLPEGTIKDIERMMNSFWWGGGANNKGIRWLAWDRMTHPKSQGGLGFRDLHTFNLAMIAKQGWNIMTNPHSLMAKVYKARYFPNSSFFESQLGHNPSYAWRGIWKARQILMNGCRWRIGNGTCINVMSEPWLRDNDGAWIPSPQVQGVYDLHVSDLMLPNMKMWDKEKIDSLFPMHIANCIMETPLLNVIEEDEIIWKDSQDGKYSVRSGYKVLMHDKQQLAATVQRDDWLRLWKIQAPPKAKHLLWRICRGCLPTRVRLQEKHVSCPLQCPLCDQECEDDWHAIFICNSSIQARQACGLDHVLVQRIQQHSNIKDLIFDVCSTESKEIAGLLAMLVWVIWQNRNSKVWNELHEIGRTLGHKARVLWEEWRDVQLLHQESRMNDQQQYTHRWERPQQGWYKCNIDAGFHRELNKTSTGWCLRDHMGRFVMAGTTWLDGNYSIIEGEAIALLEAMQAMEQQRISNVIFESDSKSVADAIQYFHGGNSEFCLVISHIHNLLSNGQNFMVKFIKRQANMVAHSLARAAISWASRCIFETLPTCISSLLINEMI